MANVTFSFGQIVPSPNFVGKNTALLQQWKDDGFFIVGAEITATNFAEINVDLNIDPQHAEKLNVSAAKKTYLEGFQLPEETEKVALCYLRPDPDSLGCLGLIVELLTAGNLAAVDAEKIDLIDKIDNSATTEWLPSSVSDEVIVEVSDYAAFSELYRNSKLSPEVKILTTLAWLKGEDVSATLAEASQGALKNKRELGEALKNGSASIAISPKGVAIFKGPGVGGSGFAYKFSPVAVLYDAKGSRNSDQPKWTICQFSAGYANIPAIEAELNAIEKCGGTWGGNPSLTGSPQGAASTISEVQILEIVDRHILPKTAEAIAVQAVNIQANRDFVASLA